MEREYKKFTKKLPEDRLSKKVLLSFSEQQYINISDKAKRANLTVSEFIRRSALGKVVKKPMFYELGTYLVQISEIVRTLYEQKQLDKNLGEKALKKIVCIFDKIITIHESKKEQDLETFLKNSQKKSKK